MPSSYAHYRFGAAILPTLPADIRRSIQRFRRLYDVGLHGPDLFYYGNPIGTKGTGALGIKYHEQTGKSFFVRICRGIRLERSEAAAAYLYGVLCHYVLDSSLHPFISLTASECGVTTLEIETELDRYLLELDGKLPPDGQRLTAHMKLTEGECETVAAFYPPVTGKGVKKALRSMVFFTKLLATAEGPGRKMLETGVKALGKEFRGALLTEKANPRCAHLDETLLQLYQEAMSHFPAYLQQMQAHMTYSAPLEGEFEKTFG